MRALGLWFGSHRGVERWFHHRVQWLEGVV